MFLNLALSTQLRYIFSSRLSQSLSSETQVGEAAVN